MFLLSIPPTNGEFREQVILFVALLVTQLFFLRTVFNIKKLGLPIYVINLVYLFIGIGGYIVYVFFPEFAYTKNEKNSYIIRITPEEAASTLLYFLYVVNVIVFGAVAFLLINAALLSLTKRKEKLVLKTQNRWVPEQNKLDFSHRLKPLDQPIAKSPEQTLARKSKPQKTGINLNAVVLMCLASDAVFIMGCGLRNLLISGSYLNINNKTLVTFGSLGLFCTTALLGYVLAESKQASKALLILLLALINLLLIFSTASRRLGFIPILFATGYNFHPNKDPQMGQIIKTAAALMFVPLFGLPLRLRAESSHGLIPYFQALSHMDLSTLLGFSLVFRNIIFSFPLTSKVMEFRNSFDLSYFITSVNPLPGGATNWYEINNDLRLSYFIPFNTVGEAYLYGDAVSFIFFFAVGLIVMYASHVSEKHASAKGGKILGLLLVGMVAVYSIFSLQYNTRAALRYLYLALVTALAIDTLRSRKI